MIRANTVENGIIMEQVKDFKYMGGWISSAEVNKDLE